MCNPPCPHPCCHNHESLGPDGSSISPAHGNNDEQNTLLQLQHKLMLIISTEHFNHQTLGKLDYHFTPLYHNMDIQSILIT